MTVHLSSWSRCRRELAASSAWSWRIWSWFHWILSYQQLVFLLATWKLCICLLCRYLQSRRIWSQIQALARLWTQLGIACVYENISSSCAKVEGGGFWLCLCDHRTVECSLPLGNFAALEMVKDSLCLHVNKLNFIGKSSQFALYFQPYR